MSPCNSDASAQPTDLSRVLHAKGQRVLVERFYSTPWWHVSCESFITFKADLILSGNLEEKMRIYFPCITCKWNG